MAHRSTYHKPCCDWWTAATYALIVSAILLAVVIIAILQRDHEFVIIDSAFRILPIALSALTSVMQFFNVVYWAVLHSQCLYNVYCTHTVFWFYISSKLTVTAYWSNRRVSVPTFTLNSRSFAACLNLVVSGLDAQLWPFFHLVCFCFFGLSSCDWYRLLFTAFTLPILNSETPIKRKQ